MPSFKLSVDDENVPWLNLTEKLPETENHCSEVMLKPKPQPQLCMHKQTHKHTLLLGDTCLLMSSPQLW